MAFHTGPSRLLPKIGQSEFAFSHVRAEVAFVGDEQDPRAVLNVAIIMDVDQEMSRNGLPLDPRMENWNEVLQTNVGRFGCEEFDAESLESQYFCPRSVRMS